MFESVFKCSSVAMAIVGLSGDWQKVNPALCRMLGYTEYELLQKTFQEVTHPDDLTANVRSYQRCLAGEIDSYLMEKRYLHKSGEVVHALLDACIVRDRSIFVINIFDITSQWLVTQRLELAIEGSGDGLWDWDLTTDYVYLSPNWYGILGYEKGEVPECLEAWKRLLHPDEVEQVLENVAEYLANPEIVEYKYRYRLLCKNGSYKWVLNHGKLCEWDSDGKPTRMAGSHRDVDDLVKLQQQLEYSAGHDALTGLYNRAQFEVISRQELGRDSSHCLALIDLNGFKAVNDTYGHLAGDFLLKTISARLPKALRKSDRVARWGGDEFILLLPDTELEFALQICDRVGAAISELIEYDGHTISVGAAIGLHVYEEGQSLQDCLRAADIAMYQAKSQCRLARLPYQCCVSASGGGFCSF